MLQGEQGGTYLAGHGRHGAADSDAVAAVRVAKTELKDMAGAVAAPDVPPAAAVLVAARARPP